MEIITLLGSNISHPKAVGEDEFPFFQLGYVIVPWRGPINMRHPVWGEAGWFDSLGSSRLVLKVGPSTLLAVADSVACQVFACRQQQAPERPLAAKVGV